VYTILRRMQTDVTSKTDTVLCRYDRRRSCASVLWRRRECVCGSRDLGSYRRRSGKCPLLPLPPLQVLSSRPWLSSRLRPPAPCTLRRSCCLHRISALCCSAEALRRLGRRRPVAATARYANDTETVKLTFAQQERQAIQCLERGWLLWNHTS